MFIEIVLASGFGDRLISGSVQTIGFDGCPLGENCPDFDFGDCPLIRIVQTVGFGDRL